MSLIAEKVFYHVTGGEEMTTFVPAYRQAGLDTCKVSSLGFLTLFQVLFY